MFQVVRNAFTKQVQYDREFLNKTAGLVRDQIQSSSIGLSNEIYKIDAEGIETIKNKYQPDEVKVINLIKSIQRLAEEKSNDPVLISVKERAEDIMDAYTSRQVTTQEALKQLLELADHEAKRNEEQEKEGISSIAWFIRDVLTKENIVDMQAVNDIELIISQYPEFAFSEKLTRDLRNGIYDRLESLGLTLSDQKKITDRIIMTVAQTSI
jgi:type I restriction enzyme R subunit